MATVFLGRIRHCRPVMQKDLVLSNVTLGLDLCFVVVQRQFLFFSRKAIIQACIKHVCQKMICHLRYQLANIMGQDPHWSFYLTWKNLNSLTHNYVSLHVYLFLNKKSIWTQKWLVLTSDLTSRYWYNPKTEHLSLVLADLIWNV